MRRLLWTFAISLALLTVVGAGLGLATARSDHGRIVRDEQRLRTQLSALQGSAAATSSQLSKVAASVDQLQSASLFSTSTSDTKALASDVRDVQSKIGDIYAQIQNLRFCIVQAVNAARTGGGVGC